MVVIEDGATLTIEKDVVVSFQINPDQPFEAPGIEVVDGRLVANGTKNKPIVLTSFDDGFKLLFEDDSRVSFLRFVTLDLSPNN